MRGLDDLVRRLAKRMAARGFVVLAPDLYAARLLDAFPPRLASVRALDPACGSGNFLYVALEMMKRLEGEVTSLMHDLGDTRPLITVDPHQFLGIELNPWAANVAELVLWIGYLQWHFREAALLLGNVKRVTDASTMLQRLTQEQLQSAA